MTATKPNVLLLILDSARARNTSVHGYHRNTTPFLERFAESATTYTQARAPAGRSLQSHASIFSGHLPQEHGISSLETKLAPGNSVFESLSERGYATGLFTDNPYLTDLDTGLSNGFDVVVNNKDLFEEGISPSAFAEEQGANHAEFLRHALRSDAPAKSVLNGLSWMVKWRFPRLAPDGVVFSRGFTYADRFEEWRETVDRDAWAACINLMDTHVPFRPADAYNEWETDESRTARENADMDDVADTERWKYALLENRYDGTIRQADAVVERIVDSLRSAGVLDETLLIVTADHGEGFGERTPIHDVPSIGHGTGVDETLLHVPLVVKTPGQTTARRVDDPVGLVDVPVAVERTVEDSSAESTFVTDRSVFAGGRDDDGAIDVSYARHGTRGVEKYVRQSRGAWTVHAPDPHTSYLLADEIPASVEREMNDLTRIDVSAETTEAVSEAARKQLTALGYTE